MLELASPALRVEVDPARGGVIRSIVGPSGDELLYRAHWPPRPLDEAAQDDAAWTEAWGGGWNVLFPNAGAECVVDVSRHPFHGAASCEPWDVLVADSGTVRLAWRDPTGLSVERELGVSSTTVTARSVVANLGERPASCVLVEHLILGPAVLGPSVRVEVPSGKLVRLADDGTPLAAASVWPHADREGERENWSIRSEGAASRFGSIGELAERSACVLDPESGLGVRVSWSREFPFLWFWEERCGYRAPPWDGRVTCLGLEPATASTSEGLAAALERGEAPSLEPGESKSFQVELEVLG